MTPAEFHKRYQGWGRDVDGVAGIQYGSITYKVIRGSAADGSQPHNNMPPYFAMPFWIRTA